MTEIATDNIYDQLRSEDLWPNDREWIPNTLFVGETGTGKGVLVRRLCRDLLRDRYGEISIVWIDFKDKGSGFEFHQDCLGLGLDDLTLFESKGDTDAGIRRNFLVKSTAATPQEREKEDKKTVEAFLDTLIRQREFRSTQEHALIKQWSQAWANLMMYQNPRKPLEEGVWAFRPNSPSWHTLLKECERDEVSREFQNLPTHPASLDRMVGPALRLLDPIFNSPAVKIRDGMGKGYDIADGLDKGMNFIFERGDASVEEGGFLLRTDSLEVIRYKQNKGKTPVILILDEAEVGRFVGPMECEALKTLRYAGLTIIVICQCPIFGGEYGEEITRDVLQNTSRHIWMRCSNWDIAAIGAKDIQGVIDPYKVHSYRKRQRIIGEQAIPTESVTRREGIREIIRREGGQSVSRIYGDPSSQNRTTSFEPSTTIRETPPSESITTAMQYRPVWEDYEEEVFMNLNDQERLLGIGIMSYDVGEYSEKFKGQVSHKKEEMPEDLWVWPNLGELKCAQHLAFLKTKPPFQKPRIPVPKSQSGSHGHKAGTGKHRQGGKKGMKRSKKGKSPTRSGKST